MDAPRSLFQGFLPSRKGSRYLIAVWGCSERLYEEPYHRVIAHQRWLQVEPLWKAKNILCN